MAKKEVGGIDVTIHAVVCNRRVGLLISLSCHDMTTEWYVPESYVNILMQMLEGSLIQLQLIKKEQGIR